MRESRRHCCAPAFSRQAAANQVRVRREVAGERMQPQRHGRHAHRGPSAHTTSAGKQDLHSLSMRVDSVAFISSARHERLASTACTSQRTFTSWARALTSSCPCRAVDRPAGCRLPQVSACHRGKRHDHRRRRRCAVRGSESMLFRMGAVTQRAVQMATPPCGVFVSQAMRKMALSDGPEQIRRPHPGRCPAAGRLRYPCAPPAPPHGVGDRPPDPAPSPLS